MLSPEPCPPSTVAEIQGLHGIITVQELLIQKLWLRGDFSQEGLKTLDGRPLRVLHPGRWNRQGGPDFQGAEVEVAGQKRVGDVEIHFYARDWRLHHHDTNPAFARVMLHVVVFDPPPQDVPVRTVEGVAVPTLLLGPYFADDIESYALHDARMALEQRDLLDVVAPVLARPLPARREMLRTLAYHRWRQKVAFAHRRLELHRTPAVALHHLVLEILGLTRNRGPMAGLAERFPLPEIRRRLTTDGLDATLEVLWQAEEGNWKLGTQRPANHPRARLRQYLELVAARPDWPEQLEAWLRRWMPEPAETEPGQPTAAFRRLTRLNARLRTLEEDILAGKIGGTRFHTLGVDAFWPMAAALGWGAEESVWARRWFHHPPGDLPDKLTDYLRLAEIPDRAWPAANGWGQGSLEAILRHDVRPWADRVPGGPREAID